MSKCKENIIIKIEPESIAEEIGIEPGDILLSINGKPVLDVFDYRYLINDEYIEMGIRTSDGEEYIAEIEKEYDEDIGIVFESGLMDRAKSCSNKCIFCFIDQLPKNMRKTLYFKDDDSRLSFLQGNYVTLTNMKDEDIDRIVYYHLSPINISVHTTDLELRKEMLHNKNADKVLDIMKRLGEAGIDMNLQIVLCNGINDGHILDKSIEDLSKFSPRAKSLSVVPIGLTKYRDGLYPMKPFSKDDARKVVNQITTWQKKLKKEIGSSFVFCADEFYLKAEMDFPEAKDYEDFPQIENGVGMISLMESEFQQVLSEIEDDKSINKTVSIATGMAAYDFIKKLSCRLSEKFDNLKINVYPIINEFFGEQITVSGLLTGRDIINQLKGKELGEYLVLPDNLLKAEETVLLDDIYLSDIENELGVGIYTNDSTGGNFIGTVLYGGKK